MNFQEFKIKAQAGKEEKINSSTFVYRWQRFLSVRLSWLLLKVFPKTLPNHVSIFNICLLWLSFLVILWAPLLYLPWWILGQLLILGLSSVLDKMDGEIARYKEHYTQQGIYYDLVYHFSYAFVLYLVLGYYFAFLSGSIIILWLATFLGLLSAIYHMLGKIRHHVRYKISLEEHTDIVKDWQSAVTAVNKKPKVLRLLDYLVFFIYDWVWVCYLILLFASLQNWAFAFMLFFVHVILSIVYLFYQIIWYYPRHNLFKRPD